MKRFIYQYTCLAYTIVQFYLFIGMLITFIKQIGIDKEYGDYFNSILLAILTLGLFFVLAIGDKFLRGIKNNNFFIDSLLLTLVLPFRFICQVLTIIGTHIAYRNGIESFGTRGNNSTELSNYIIYYVFNTDSLNPKTGEEIRFETRKGFENRQRQQAIESQKAAKKEREKSEVNNFIKNNKRSDNRYNVYIVPLCKIDTDEYSTLHVENGIYQGERYVDRLTVNGINLINNEKHDNPFALSLKPGYYDFQIHISGNVKVSDLKNSEEKVDQTFTLKNVKISSEVIYLCLSLSFDTVVTKLVDAAGVFVGNKFHHYEENHRFAAVTVTALNNACEYWPAHITEIN